MPTTPKDTIMKNNWLKRTLVGVAVTAALAGSVAAYSQGGDFHRGPPSAEAMAQHQSEMLAHIGKRLKLDAKQAAKLKTLADVIEAQRPGPKTPPPAAKDGAERPEPPQDPIRALIEGDKFDRAGAQKQLNEKIARLQTGGPALINAAADFFDSLSVRQQQQVRDFADEHHGPFGFGFGLFGHGHEHGPEHGHEGGPREHGERGEHGDRDGGPQDGGPRDGGPRGHGDHLPPPFPASAPASR